MSEMVPAKVEIKGTSKAEVMFTLIPFPAKWDTTLQQFVSEPELNVIFTELGRLAVVYNHMDQGVFDALSYLINHSDYVSAVRAAELIRGFTIGESS